MPDKQFIVANNAPRNIGINEGNFSQAVKIGNTVYIGGTLPIDAKTYTIINDTPQKEIHTAYSNLSNICEANGGKMQNIVMLSVMVTDLEWLSLINSVQASFILPPHPPRTTVQVAALPHGCRIELAALTYSPP